MSAAASGAGGRPGFTVPPGFWADFVERHWEKEALALRKPFGGLLADAQEVFPALVRASAAARASDGGAMLRLYIDKARQDPKSTPYLPTQEDESVEGYARRLASRLGDASFTLVVHSIQAYSVPLWARLREFIGGLVERIGLPSSRVDADVFLGNYRTTPFGVHKDTAATFSLVLAGRKQMRVWPFEALRDLAPSDALRREVALSGSSLENASGSSILLEGEPGDVLYWPSTYWHVGEAGGGLHMCLNVSLYFPWQPLSQIELMARRRAEARLGEQGWVDAYRFDAARPQRSAERLPDEVAAALEAFRKAASDPALERAVRASWLNRMSATGFTSTPPPLARAAIGDDELVTGDPRYPILWQRCDEDMLLCSANGHSFTVPAHPEVITVLERLSSGQATSAARLHEALASAEGGAALGLDDVRALVVQALKLRAVTR